MYKEKQQQQQPIPRPQANTCPRFAELIFPHCTNNTFLPFLNILCSGNNTFPPIPSILSNCSHSRESESPSTVYLPRLLATLFINTPRTDLVYVFFPIPGRPVNVFLSRSRREKNSAWTTQQNTTEEKRSPPTLLCG